jgi:hypothetical protein
MQIPPGRVGALFLGAEYDPKTNKIHLIGGKSSSSICSTGSCEVTPGLTKCSSDIYQEAKEKTNGACD